jgi:uncharacterized protein
MSVNKIIIIVGVIFAIFLAFILIQFNPLGKSPLKKDVPSVVIKDHTFTVTIASTELQRQQGLSGQASLPLTEGKLFLFDHPDVYAFWMKGMKFPIDIIFIKDNKIVSITENAQPATTEEPQIYQPTGSINAALEINAGLSKKYNFKPGDTVDIAIPTLSPSPQPKK